MLPELNALVGVWDQDTVVEADVRDMPSVWLSADHQVSCCSMQQSMEALPLKSQLIDISETMAGGADR